MNRIAEIEARLATINSEIANATGEAFSALESEANQLCEERSALVAENEARSALRSKIAAGAVATTPAAPVVESDVQARAAEEFKRTGRMSVGVEQARSVLVSGGTLATPTEVSGINDKAGAKVSSILDLVTVVNTQGMSTNRVAYIAADDDAAGVQTEGSAAGTVEPTFSYVDIQPTSVAVLSQISKQAKKQSPLNYQAKVQSQAYIALRKKAAAVVTNALKNSTLPTGVNGTIASSKGKIDEKTLRKLVLNLGGDEGVSAGVLFLNKTDLLAFGDVRGTSEKKAVYEITPDSENPNTGVIRDGGLAVRYCINSGLTAFDGTTQAASSGADKKTMYYGDPRAIELDLFSDYEIKVSEDFAFSSLMDTIRGDVEVGAGVVQAGAFVYLNLPKAT